MTFRDTAHEAFYYQAISQDLTEATPSRRALFYTLGLLETTRKHMDDLYNFSRHIIKEEGLDRQWQTETSRRVCRLAFNLFNGYHGRRIYQGMEFTPWRLFEKSDFLPYFLEAVQIRFGTESQEDGPPTTL